MIMNMKRDNNPPQILPIPGSPSGGWPSEDYDTIWGRAGARLFPLEFDGQFRMVRRLRHPFRTDPCKFHEAKTHAEAERIVLPEGQRAKCGGLNQSGRTRGSAPDRRSALTFSTVPG
jgi:hypothetical protein